MVLPEKCPPFWLSNRGRLGSASGIEAAYSASARCRRWFTYCTCSAALALPALQNELAAHCTSVVVNISDEEAGNFFGPQARVETDQYDCSVTQRMTTRVTIL